MSKRTGDRITDLADDIRAASSAHFRISSPEESSRRATKARETRLRQRGGALCRVCKGTRYSRPDTVCRCCLGRGYVISREASTGSWFEFETPSQIKLAVAKRKTQGLPVGSGRVLRSMHW